MPRLIPIDNFEPRRNTKYWWRFTRKSSTLYGDVTLPGLFQTAQIKFDLAAFVVIIFGEIVGLANLWALGQVSLFAIISLVLVDITFALGLHIPKGPINIAKNERVVEDDPNEKARLEHKIRRLKPWILFCTVVILIVALIKMGLFYVLQGAIFDGLTLAIVLSYAIVAILHITSTGNVIFEGILSFQIWRDRSAFLSQNKKKSEPCTITDYREYKFQTDVELQTVATTDHRLYKDPDTKDKYILKTFGILKDHELQSLIMHQNNDKQQSILAIEGLRHQLDIMQSEPIRGGSPVPPTPIRGDSSVPRTPEAPRDSGPTTDTLRDDIVVAETNENGR